MFLQEIVLEYFQPVNNKALPSNINNKFKYHFDLLDLNKILKEQNNVSRDVELGYI